MPIGVFLMLAACGVAAIVYGGMHFGRLDLAEYNKAAEREYREARGLNDSYDMVNGAICGMIMMIATIVGLTMLFGFDGGPRGLFWLSWVIGGLLAASPRSSSKRSKRPGAGMMTTSSSDVVYRLRARIVKVRIAAAANMDM